jgi:uncharacterized membrane protein YfcA
LELAAIPFGIAIGLAVGGLGGGGSVLAVPVLVYVLGQNVQDATTASLVVVTAGALAGGLAHHRSGRVCWRHAGLFTVAAVPGIAAGTAAGGAVGGSLLLALFALLMLAAAVGSWRRAVRREDGSEAACPPLWPRRDIVAGLVIGFATGFFGVGGGFLVVPTLAMALAFSMRPAVGTSLVIVTLTSLFGLAAHLLAGRELDVSLASAMAAACAFGAVAGAAAAGRLPVEHLRRGFAGLVALVALYLLVSAVALGGPAGG